ncbi:hypothetical protein [Nocardiopsis lucentensis]|uniref:hypothetical protein n=1 Tax=Nocardiopsis lucentensis TaxID=53441 RepID=UPI000347C0D7|nr:hypothetical protein [Nocardiopsis lucentensis]
MSKSRSIGTRAETGVVRYLRDHGWPSAERRALAGEHDLGDIVGTPGICWEIKGGKTAESAHDADVTRWLAETEQETANSGADLGILVTKRRSYSAASVGSWWAHLDLTTWHALNRGRLPLRPDIVGRPIRMHLSTLVPILRAAGYGSSGGDATEPLDEVA